MDTTKLPTIIIADPPFHDPSNCADLVIRTADNVDFFVLKVLLSLDSPSSFFRHVLQASHHTEERDNLPVLEVKEDSSIFRILLFFCYPYKIPEIRDFKQFTDVGTALEKYCIDNAFERFIEAVLASSVIKEQPARVFSVAVGNGWKKLAETAMRNTLAIPLEPEVEFEEFRNMNALQHFRLRDYHRKCGKAVQDLNIKEKEQFSTNASMGHAQFVSMVSQVDVIFNPDSIKEPLLPDIALDEDIIQRTIAASISECSSDEWAEIAASKVRLLGKLLAKEIDERISAVPLNMEWTK
ncbi:uncharacterized protein EV420DRAFT_1636562 [Desarmillaria tabescens]|uniref:BTB domain-containing protein n=1 Tax=Armillaria tabescens TaxID=1929756 RepID=A0AA39TXE8_ARMTA|nr:uncharacterized protein EV420DRAFT_1636562 [Desarmillaria tabescens]KAK0465989.1 hypothetical protein EV420DRAFT_1636562 [Desarmillaria tabescens]